MVLRSAIRAVTYKRDPSSFFYLIYASCDTWQSITVSGYKNATKIRIPWHIHILVYFVYVKDKGQSKLHNACSQKKGP